MRLIPGLTRSRSADLGVAGLYALMALGLLAPFASVTVLPLLPDVVAHVGFIVQARMALEEGQFPLRVAPWELGGLRYPSFQYYGQFPDTLGGLLYRFATPSNPYQTVLILIFLAFAVGAFGMYRLTLDLTERPYAAILAGAAYMLAPYFIVNVAGRGDLTESVAQGVIPLVVLLNLRAVRKPRVTSLLWATLAWVCLAMTHLITLLCLIPFLSAFLIWLAWPKQAWRGLLLSAAALALAILASAYYLVPIADSSELRIRELLGQPFDANWLTQLPSMFSVASVSAEPRSGNGRIPPNLNPAAGWVLLAAWAVTCWARWAPTGIFFPGSREWLERVRWTAIANPALALFALALVVTWSPVDFWSRLPSEFRVVQFPYRLYAQVDWLGAILVSLAAWALFGATLGPRHVVVGILLFGALSASYVPTLLSTNVTIAQVQAEPSLGYGATDYLYVGKQPEVLGGEELPLYGDDGFLQPGASVVVPATLLGSGATLHLAGTAREDWYPNGLRLALLSDGVPFAERQIAPGAFTWDVPLPDSAAPFRLSASPSETRIPHELDPDNSDRRALSVKLSAFRMGQTPPEATVIPVAELVPSVRNVGPERQVDVTVSADRQLVQLPILYYPDMLDIRVDGQSTPYVQSHRQNVSLAAVRLPPGQYHITMAFTGSRWGNLISVLAWLGLLALVVFVGVRWLVRRARWRSVR